MASQAASNLRYHRKPCAKTLKRHAEGQGPTQILAHHAAILLEGTSNNAQRIPSSFKKKKKLPKSSKATTKPKASPTSGLAVSANRGSPIVAKEPDVYQVEGVDNDVEMRCASPFDDPSSVPSEIPAHTPETSLPIPTTSSAPPNAAPLEREEVNPWVFEAINENIETMEEVNQPTLLEYEEIELWDEIANDQHSEDSDGGRSSESEAEDWAGLPELPSLAESVDAEWAAKRPFSISESDWQSIKCFLFLHESKSGDNSFKTMHKYYPSTQRPSKKVLQRRIHELCNMRGVYYDCCTNICCAYTGPQKSLEKCPHCCEPRYDEKGKARRQYLYIAMIPRVQGLYATKESAKRQRYRAEQHKSEPGVIKDYIDGQLYKDLCGRRVEVGGKMLEYNYFSDPRDVGLLLLSDGFRIFKRGQHSAWGTTAVNLNLPPDVRCHLEETLLVCIIPGPNQPKDPDSFHFPLAEELNEAAFGVKTFDALEACYFKLRIHPLLASADGPGASKAWLHNKQHGAYSPCRNCEIHGMQAPIPPGKKQAAPTMYIPLTPPEGSTREVMDPLNLPLRTHEKWLQQAKEVQMAPTEAAHNKLSREYGINGTSILANFGSLQFPNSFPVDVMHLLENIMEALVKLWTGQGKLDAGREDYLLAETVWDAVGAATAGASTTLPASFGRRLDNIAVSRGYFTAESWFIWSTLLSPAILNNRFKRPIYYRHFMKLIQLLKECLSWEIKVEHLKEIKVGLADWVLEFERIYYQYDKDRISVCTLQFHMLLHLADTISNVGPAWVYWVFVMERLCGRLQRSVTSRRFPYSSMNSWATGWEQIKLLKKLFYLQGRLGALENKEKRELRNSVYPHSKLLGPCKVQPLEPGLHRRIVAAVGTRYGRTNQQVQKLVPTMIASWARVQRLDGGDLLRTASSVRKTAGSYRDNSHVRYELLIDRNARFKKRKEDLYVCSFFGELNGLYEVPLPAHPLLDDHPSTLLLAAVRPCDTTLDVESGLYTYSTYKPLEVVDLNAIQSVVGRVFDRGCWSIIDRSGDLARATFTGLDES